MLTIVGGTYLEYCQTPEYEGLYGSGLRAAAAISEFISAIDFISCLGAQDRQSAESICNTFGINATFYTIPDTVVFDYFHPLSKPVHYLHPELVNKIELPEIETEYVLYYGMVEANIKITADYVVYDPQNWESFKQTGSNANHLAIVLNKNEAILLSQSEPGEALEKVGKKLLIQEKAEIVVIKNGSNGALVIEESQITEVPVFKTSRVWPIGSGDIFSAVFAWKWMIEKMPASHAALTASQATAQFCETKTLPLQLNYPLDPLPINQTGKFIYLAGPLFTVADKYFITDVRNILLDFGNKVFSPLHDVGMSSTNSEIADKDLEALKDVDAVFAIINGMDAGTLFEIGYARSIGKRVVALAENVNENDLTMLLGSGCEVENDLTTAIYKVSWH
jgi:hypothetical protein